MAALTQFGIFLTLNRELLSVNNPGLLSQVLAVNESAEKIAGSLKHNTVETWRRICNLVNLKDFQFEFCVPSFVPC